MAKTQNAKIKDEKVSGGKKAEIGNTKKNIPKSTENKSWIGRAFKKTGYVIWITILIVGGTLAFIVSLVAV